MAETSKGDIVDVRLNEREFSVRYKGEIKVDFDFSEIGFLLHRKPDTTFNDLIDRLNDSAEYSVIDSNHPIKSGYLLWPCEDIGGGYSDILKEIDIEDGGALTAFSAYERDGGLSVGETMVDFEPRMVDSMYKTRWVSRLSGIEE